MNVGESVHPGHDITVTLTSVLPFAEYSVRKMTVTCVSNKPFLKHTMYVQLVNHTLKPYYYLNNLITEQYLTSEYTLNNLITEHFYYFFLHSIYSLYVVRMTEKVKIHFSVC